MAFTVATNMGRENLYEGGLRSRHTAFDPVDYIYGEMNSAQVVNQYIKRPENPN